MTVSFRTPPISVLVGFGFSHDDFGEGDDDGFDDGLDSGKFSVSACGGLAVYSFTKEIGMRMTMVVVDGHASSYSLCL